MRSCFEKQTKEWLTECKYVKLGQAGGWENAKQKRRGEMRGQLKKQGFQTGLAWDPAPQSTLPQRFHLIWHSTKHISYHVLWPMLQRPRTLRIELVNEMPRCHHSRAQMLTQIVYCPITNQWLLCKGIIQGRQERKGKWEGSLEKTKKEIIKHRVKQAARKRRGDGVTRKAKGEGSLWLESWARKQPGVVVYVFNLSI